MRKNKVTGFLFLFAFSIGLLIFLIFLTLPKFILLDRILQKNGIYIITKSVKEGLFSIELEDVVLYDRNSKIAKFKNLYIKLTPIYLLLYAKNSSGYFETRYYFMHNDYLIKAKELTSFERFYLKEANIELKKDIQGQIKLEKVKISGTDIDEINILFKEKSFDISLQGKEINAKGSGIIVIDDKNILDSKLTGEVIDKNIKIIVGGSIKNIIFQINPIF